MMTSTPRMFIGTISFQVTGMSCGHCQRAVAEEIGRVPGVRSVTVDPSTGTVTVAVDPAVDRADIAAAVDAAGHVLIA